MVVSLCTAAFLVLFVFYQVCEKFGVDRFTSAWNNSTYHCINLRQGTEDRRNKNLNL